MELNIKFDKKMLAEMANRVLDEYEYNGKTIREWADLIANSKTKAAKIRVMSDEELAEFLNNHNFCARNFDCEKGMRSCRECNLDWLKQEGKVEEDE